MLIMNYTDRITMSIDGHTVSQATDSSRLTGGAVGLRANQAAIKVLSFQVLSVGS